MNNPHVLYIISGDLFAGKEVQLLNLITELDQIGISTAVVIFNQGILFEKLKQSRTEIYYVDEKKGFLNLVIAVCSILKRKKPKIIVAQNYKEAIVGWFSNWPKKAKFILHFHGDIERSSAFKNFKINLYYCFYRTLAKFSADALIFPSRELMKQLDLELPKSRVIYSSYSYSGQKEDLIFSAPTILCAGRLVRVKRLDMAIKAYMLFIDTYFSQSSQKPKLYIVGDGPEREKLENLVAELNLVENVSFLGFKENILDYLKSSSLLLLSSDHEGVPTIILEAISVGVPLVATRVGGVPEVMKLFKRYNYQLVEKENLNALATAINSVLGQKMDSNICNENLKILEENFSTKIIASKHFALYQEICL